MPEATGAAPPTDTSNTTTPAESGGASASTATTTPQESPASPPGNLLQRLLGMGRQTFTVSNGAPQETSESAAQEQEDEGEATQEPTKRTVTDEELARLVQAEADRREAKRARAEREQQEAARRQALERQRRDALDDGDADTARAAEQQLQALEAQQRYVGGLVASYDAATLDVLRDRLPEDARGKLLAELSELPPLEGRKAFVEKSLEAIVKEAEARGEQRAEERLRKDDGFRKRLLHGERDEAEDDEPDLILAAGAGRNGRANLNEWMRSAVQR